MGLPIVHLFPLLLTYRIGVNSNYLGSEIFKECLTDIGHNLSLQPVHAMTYKYAFLSNPTKVDDDIAKEAKYDMMSTLHHCWENYWKSLRREEQILLYEKYFRGNTLSFKK